MINAFGNYIGFGNPQIYPLFNVSGSVDVYNVGNDTVFSFYNDSGSAAQPQGTGSIKFSQNYRVEYLVVAGGGRGGIEQGGGGGGGVQSGSFTAIANQPYDIRVGFGGQWDQTSGIDFGNTGSVSYITGSTLPFSIVSFAGGRGAGSMAINRDTGSAPASNGGSGGGGGGHITIQAGGTGSQGSNGGSGSLASNVSGPGPTPGDTTSYWIGGGGGGATSVGTSGSSFVAGLYTYPRPGNGGSGSFSYIGSTTGSWYAGGGGADFVSSLNYSTFDYTLFPTGSGGIGGGGNAYSDGQQRTGGGGGAAGSNYRTGGITPIFYGNGGSGIVILRVNLNNALPA
jgi:hypothetical protein